MSKFNSDKVMPRYFVIAVVLTLIGFAVVGKAMYIMTAKKDYWTQVASRLKRDSVTVKPNRGNILSCDGQLMASSIPEYKVYMDFQAGAEDSTGVHKRDSIWAAEIDTICYGLNQIFPQKSAAEFKAHLLEGKRKVMKNGTVGARHWAIWPRRIDYNTFCEVHELPIFREKLYKGGFHWETFNSRRKPFGTLAQRTIGEMYGAKDSAKNGLELSLDTLLRGKNGLMHRRKILSKYLDIPVLSPEDGVDVVTTIDVGMQDLAERALVDELKEINGEMGVAILMEVKTGDVKAIVNMTRGLDGNYYEMVNNAISYRCEPGSVFKVASFLVALDDGVIDTTMTIPTGCGVMEMHGRPMKDHNWRRGGYGTINVARALEVSSNIGVSYLIDKYYGHNPKKYVEGLYRIGIHEDLKLPLVGYHTPMIRMPDTKTTDRSKYWSKTTLPWMSIGYETQIAPINTVAFYNAIANNGKLMQPRFVKQLMKNGEVIREFEPVVLKERIAKPQTIKTMQTILEHVVSQGLGKKAGSKSFKVAGKTGTAQVADQFGSYHSGVTRYWLSFAGFFPADNPRYTCIVCLKKSGLPASGGGMSGVVFHHIAEGVMAQSLKRSVDDARDSRSSFTPAVKKGDSQAANYVLASLKTKASVPSSANYREGSKHTVPDVTGMGAKDAVYLLESRRVKARIKGRGKVKSQSIHAGTAVKQGMVCELILD
ncbi:MAG: transpeptidase family protein [Prevotella sp.]|uniref:Cell division protein FtsI (Penicillin-binding protein 3) n=1 Tax=Xylanibacter ruminicola TaxID=839 RepID=A0A1M7IHM2_XYLRU|nr:penicillin-binding protein [Xylanibacter ruminicola]MBP3246323.1 transpeptidase family protein [Prevotella sp.]MBQ6917148.1 transpeptidase family protein [Prevotella sp.]MBR0187591.1 transpeptidase family protein [Prevotella sp.]MBR0388678.1 transpeptidase family protein [Prevotella sp.]SFB79198.1 cell division protein FtsI (penicillin-binding protein 3) [Xylanibacter ruminicola]